MAMQVRGHKSRIAEGDIPIAGVKSSRIYSDVSPFKRATDLMIHWNEFVFKIMPEDIRDSGFRLASIPVVPITEINNILKKRETTNYVHWGALSISIDALFKKNAGVTGQCYVFDKRWTTFDQALLQKFEFNLDKGSATMITSPNFSVALDDPGLTDSICVAVVFENLNFKKDNYPISVRVGNMCRFFDSFLSCIKNKDDSNLKLDSSNVEALGLGEFGFDGDTKVNELFKYVQAVPTTAFHTRKFKIPRGFLGLMGKKKVKSFEFSSKSVKERRRRRSQAPIHEQHGIREKENFADVRSTASEDESDRTFGKLERRRKDKGIKAGSAYSEGELIDNISSREFLFAQQDKKPQDVSSTESSQQGGHPTEGIFGSGGGTSAWKDRGNSGTDTSVNIRKHRNSRDVRANRVPKRGGGSERTGGFHFASELQPEDGSQSDQNVQDILHGWKHQWDDLQAAL
ncbi:51 kDa protein [Trichovirus armeniacae]|uniref:51 kDa protein n=1 Tax=Trichovirus armeniacae TaxID=307677 RepID=Q5IJA2_9VIRU|nr:51 kDa protein [Apricot pseudo-chlorotic leaf spot virus]AAW55582.1 51 kDa protein [Apricot pseudo-chlorotic leaf spot virus]